MKNSDISEKIVILDWSLVHWRHIQTIVVGLMSFAAYVLCLYWFMLNYLVFLTPVGFFIFQMSVGITATRVFFKVGGNARRQIRFMDPSSINSSWEEEVAKVTLPELSHVFERIHNILEQRQTKEIDDLNDVALFIVSVWSAVSTAFIAAFGPAILVWGASPFVMSLISGLMYINGYRSTEPRHFEDDISQLEYVLSQRLTEVCCINSQESSEVSVYWFVKGKKRILKEISVEVYYKNAGPDIDLRIRYCFGIPSKQKERFIISSREIITSEFIDQLHSVSIVVNHNWEMYVKENGGGMIVVISNPVSSLSFEKERLIVSPQLRPREERKRIEMTVRDIVKIFGIIKQ